MAQEQIPFQKNRSVAKRKIIFIRHGRSEFNEQYIESEENCPPHDPWLIDSELSEKGLQQVTEFNEFLQNLFTNNIVNNSSLKFQIISSPLLRSIQTCYYVLKTHKILDSSFTKDNFKIKLDPDCTELEESSCDVGSTFKELLENSKVNSFLNYFDLELIKNKEKWWYHNNDCNNLQTVQFEPWDYFMERVNRFVNSIMKLLENGVETVIVFSHFTFIRECVNLLVNLLKLESVDSIVGCELPVRKVIPISNLENREVIVLEF
ncbi:hypothetical protein ABK040_013710 [Willaertia magna]